jgi:uncharacterized membrane protein YphA (DoxX/SURF4 family)
MVEQTADRRPEIILGCAGLRLLGGVSMPGSEDFAGAMRQWFARRSVRWIALLGLCAAYVQGALVKAFDFSGAIAEMNHFGLSPAAPLALLTIAMELGASILVLTGFFRWLGALALAGFTLFATFVALRFWELEQLARGMAANAFFEHLGLVGGFLLVAWHDLELK